MGLGELMRTDNWKNEKHVPVIDSPDQVPVDEMFEVQVSIGKEIAHPNTTEHHIRWIGLFFKPDGDPNTYDVGQFSFNAHGESVKGPNEGPVYTHHGVKTMLKIAGTGTLTASAYCNIHGLWQSSKRVTTRGQSWAVS